MEVKVLLKYNRSRLDGVLIRQINVYSDNTVKIVSENGTAYDTYIEGVAENDFSADQIICCIQEDSRIKVSKY